MPTTASAEAPRPGHDWHGLPPGRRAATRARARLHAIDRRRRHARVLDAHLARLDPTSAARELHDDGPASGSEQERRELANELARNGFDPAYLARRYGITPRTNRPGHDDGRGGHGGQNSGDRPGRRGTAPWTGRAVTDTTPGHLSGHEPGQRRGGQRQLSAPDTQTGHPGKGGPAVQTDRDSYRQEGTR